MPPGGKEPSWPSCRELRGTAATCVTKSMEYSVHLRAGYCFIFMKIFLLNLGFFASQVPGKAVTATRGGEAASVLSKCFLSKTNNKTKLQGKKIEGIKDFNK